MPRVLDGLLWELYCVQSVLDALQWELYVCHEFSTVSREFSTLFRDPELLPMETLRLAPPLLRAQRRQIATNHDLKR